MNALAPLDPRASGVAASLRSLLPGRFRVAVQPVLPDRADLPMAEAVAVNSAIPSRRAEFAAGRQAARLCLNGLGHRDAVIPVGHGRAPQWPAGITGSIAHSQGLAVATAAPAQDARGVGLDIEPRAPLPEEIVAEILLPEEQAELAQDCLDRVLFCAKEALFKALFPVSGVWFGFHDARILVTGATRFSATLHRPIGAYPAGSRFDGRFCTVDNLILAALVLRHHHR